MDKLFQIASEPIAAHRGSFIGIVIFSSAFYFIYAWFREQVCTIMCPYGRLQGVLTDNNTITVSYDYFRGEPRGMEKKDKPEQKFGDCVDCKECIRVCPTGIDIRNGSQLECINCTACIDACNSVMTKVKKPTGLIRYSSENGLKTGKSFKFTTRNIAYTTVLTGILVFLTTLLLTRTETETTILRARGLTYQTQPDDNQISNLYNLTIVNKSHRTINASVRILSHKGNVQIHGTDLSLETGKSIEGTMIVFLEKADVKSERTKIEFGIYDGDVLIEKRTTDFIGPN
jgi:cytochrome c oxidase accessory protein FixG